MEDFLGGGPRTNRRGVSKLALHLKVHPTFIAKVLGEKADFSCEQAVSFCNYANFSAGDTEYFVDLLLRDRAGDPGTRAHFEERLCRQRELSENLKRRLDSSRDLTIEEQLEYYESWLPQAVHLLCQSTGRHTPASIALRLGIQPQQVENLTAKLIHMGLLVRRDGAFFSEVDFIHTGKDSPLVGRLHVNWRLKIISDLLIGKGSDGVHFSAVAAMSVATALQIRELLISSLESAKRSIATSPSETLQVLAIDFYGL